jgi:hypothetical protein
MKTKSPINPMIPVNFTGLNVELGEVKVLRTIPERIISADKIEIEQIIDNYAQKKITAITKSVLGQVILWEGAAYDAIGQWSDEDVKARILQLINA